MLLPDSLFHEIMPGSRFCIAALRVVEGKEPSSKTKNKIQNENKKQKSDHPLPLQQGCERAHYGIIVH